VSPSGECTCTCNAEFENVTAAWLSVVAISNIPVDQSQNEISF